MILYGPNVLTLSVSYSKHFLPYTVAFEEDEGSSAI